MSGGHSKSESENETGFKQDVWGPQSTALTQMYGQMPGVFNQTNTGIQSLTPGATDWMQGVQNQSQPFWQQQMGGGAFEGMDLQKDYSNALASGGGNEQWLDQSIMGGEGNDYADAMKAKMTADATRNLGGNIGMNDLRASNLGQPGSSRHGMVESNLYKDSNDRLMDNINTIGYDTFKDDQDRKMGIARRADTYDMNRLNNISGMMGQQQNAMQGGLGYGGQMQNLGMGQFAPQMMPWQAANQYAGTLGSPTILGSGSMTGSSDSKSMQGGVG